MSCRGGVVDDEAVAGDTAVPGRVPRHRAERVAAVAEPGGVDVEPVRRGLVLTDESPVDVERDLGDAVVVEGGRGEGDGVPHRGAGPGRLERHRGSLDVAVDGTHPDRAGGGDRALGVGAAGDVVAALPPHEGEPRTW